MHVVRRVVASLLAVGLAGVVITLTPVSASAAVAPPWTGTITTENVGAPEDEVSVQAIPGISTLTVTHHRDWQSRMTWTPLADGASSPDSFDTVMKAEATGSFRLVEWTDSHFVYDPAVCASRCSWQCRTTTVTLWSGTVATDGPILPTEIAVSVGEAPGGGFDTTVRATMSVDQGVNGATVTTTVTGTDINGEPCPGDPSTTTESPWHDSVTMTVHTETEPTVLHETQDVAAASLISPDDTAVGTIDMRNDVGSIAVGAQTSPAVQSPPTFSYVGDLTATRVADGTATSPVAKTPGTYTVTQEPVEGWQVLSGTCTDSDSTVDATAATATYRVGWNEDVVCTFTVGPTGKGTLSGDYSYYQGGGSKLTYLVGVERGRLDVPVGTQVSRIGLYATLDIEVRNYKDSLALVFNGLDSGEGQPGGSGISQPCLGGSCEGQIVWTLTDRTLKVDNQKPPRTSTVFHYEGYRECTGAVTDCQATIGVRALPTSGILTNISFSASVDALVRGRVRGPLTMDALPPVKGAHAGIAAPLTFTL